ncbi:MAG: helix-turn-helix transcriptional regulator, partial [Hymenobacter sp.]|nr:helix-turn-helix transcriptional regulator [Hymenobacter sp.]
MTRRSPPAPTLPARVRAWLGLTQAQLSLYLGVSQTLLQAIEAGQRRLSPNVSVALLPLLLQLPPPATPADPGP